MTGRRSPGWRIASRNWRASLERAVSYVDLAGVLRQLTAIAMCCVTQGLTPMTTATGMCRDRPRLRACFRAALTLILWWGLGQTAWAATPPNAANAPLRVGLVLGGGGARGLAHLGIIDELEKLHIPISCIAGTSAGALVGGIYATGADVTELIQKVKTADWNSLLSGAPDRRKLPYLRKIDDNKNLSSPTIGLTADGLSVGRSLVGSQRIDRFLRELTGGLTLSLIHI